MLLALPRCGGYQPKALELSRPLDVDRRNGLENARPLAPFLSNAQACQEEYSAHFAACRKTAESVCRNVCRSVPADGVKYGRVVPVPEHKTRGPHGTPRLFSPLLYQLSYLAEGRETS